MKKLTDRKLEKPYRYYLIDNKTNHHFSVNSKNALINYINEDTNSINITFHKYYYYILFLSCILSLFFKEFLYFQLGACMVISIMGILNAIYIK